MEMKAAIFDMDGLLIDSEPLWQEAGRETLAELGCNLTLEQYHTSTGLRTEEWIEHWFHFFGIELQLAPAAVTTIIHKAIQKIDSRGTVFAGAAAAIEQFRLAGYRVGIATSSPMELVEVVLPKLQLPAAPDAVASAGTLPYGKPHPEVYLNCATALKVHPLQCVAFEDSFNGMIAAKAARMKCIVVPAPADFDAPKWQAADLKLPNLSAFKMELLQQL